MPDAFAANVSDNGQLLNGANLVISIVTLMLLPLPQASQKRHGAAMQAKLDELVKVNIEARDAMIGLENRSEEEIEQMRLGREGRGYCD